MLIGLSATPVTKGLGSVYNTVVNSETTIRLTDKGYLAPLRVYYAKSDKGMIDMTGAPTPAGEYQAKDIAERSTPIVGSVVTSWINRCNIELGGPAKTLMFTATVGDGERYCREFQAAGFRFEQISYKDRDEKDRKRKVQMFRDGEIIGLISCEALAQGFRCGRRYGTH